MNAPKKVTWLISLLLGAAGILGRFVAIPFVSANQFWFLAAGYALLLVSCLIKGL